MKSSGFFITGTDTGVGKTFVTLALLQVLQRHGLRAVGMKPVATDAVFRCGAWVNDDALLLQAAGSRCLPYETVNPFVFQEPVSPHIAATRAGVRIDLAEILRNYREMEAFADCILVEGVGGWQVPLNDRQKVSDLAVALGLPVILVVGLRLGCLNHALLTHAAIADSGLAIAGWVANGVDPAFSAVRENIETLSRELNSVPLAELPFRGATNAEADDGIIASFDTEEILRALDA